MKKIVAILIALSVCAGISAQNDFEIAKNVDIFIGVLNELNDKYADEISPGTLTQTAIKAMLKSLDPYTVYYPESQVENARMHNTGDYGDADLSIEIIDNSFVITDLKEDGPSANAGLRIGDKILKINGQPLRSNSAETALIALRGQPGTTCKIEVFRPSANENLQFNVVRKKLSTQSVPYFGMLDEKVGYIKLDAFTEKAGKEVFDAFKSLKEKGMQSLIFDLRENGGGLLGEAVNIVDIFVDAGVQVVETKGKIPEMNQVYKTSNPAFDKEIPIVVLVNEHSASASEIVSGSLQDLDRAVIVGKKSFGKGLVQKIYPMDYNTSMKITVSKYYIPSGRCVQNIEYFDQDTTQGAYKIPDSLAVAFKTKNGRTVYDKGGVEPDVVVLDAEPSETLLSLIENRAIFDFANNYRNNHENIASAENFVVNDNIYAEFVKFVNENNYLTSSSLDEILNEFKETASNENSYDEFKDVVEKLQLRIDEHKKNGLNKNKSEISRYLTQEIVLRYYFSTGKLVNSLQSDEFVNTAKLILNDRNRYNKILNVAQ